MLCSISTTESLHIPEGQRGRGAYPACPRSPCAGVPAHWRWTVPASPCPPLSPCPCSGSRTGTLARGTQRRATAGSRSRYLPRGCEMVQLHKKCHREKSSPSSGQHPPPWQVRMGSQHASSTAWPRCPCPGQTVAALAGDLPGTHFSWDQGSRAQPRADTLSALRYGYAVGQPALNCETE